MRTLRSRLLLGLVTLAVATLPARAPAQQPAAIDTTFLRAHRLVSLGEGEAGRAIIDSIIRVTPAGTPAYAEGLFWRAVTAVRAEDAERDYLRIVVEFPLSPRAEDALIRLAELEMMRGDRLRAQRHLQRLIVEHPNGVSRARASYWLARVFFESNDLPRACNELNVAKLRAAPGDVELRNQVDYQAQRCVGVDVVTPNPQAPAPASTVGQTASVPPGTTNPPANPPAANPPATNLPPQTPPPASVPPVRQTPPPPAPTGTVSAPPASPPSRASSSVARGAPGFTVQVAAFPTRAAADSFRESLAARGYDVRVWGTENPFRVRVGRFATRAEASALAQELRAKMIARDAFVTEAEVR
jgi:cell division protein FtsN